MVKPLTAGTIFDTMTDIPADHTPSRDTYPVHLAGPKVKARKTILGGSATRWCATCHTTLEANGRGKFCHGCVNDRNQAKGEARRATPITELPVDVEVLRRLHREARALSEVTNQYLNVRHDADREAIIAALSNITAMGKMLQSTISAMPKPAKPRPTK